MNEQQRNLISNLIPWIMMAVVLVGGVYFSLIGGGTISKVEATSKLFDQLSKQVEQNSENSQNNAKGIIAMLDRMSRVDKNAQNYEILRKRFDEFQALNPNLNYPKIILSSAGEEDEEK